MKKYIRDGRAPIPEKEVTSRIMSSIKAKNTKPELLFRKALWNSGLKGYRLHWKKVPGKPDIAFVKYKLAIFVNGCFWHKCPHCQPALPKSNTEFWNIKLTRNQERDLRKVADLEKIGWTSLTLWECQMKNINEIVASIKSKLI